MSTNKYIIELNEDEFARACKIISSYELHREKLRNQYKKRVQTYTHLPLLDLNTKIVNIIPQDYR